MSDQIENSVELKAPISRVWRALTDYREFGEWFGVKLEKPFARGLASKGHITHPGYEHIQWESITQKIEPEYLFSFTWHPYAIDPKKDYSGETPTLVEFRLERTAAGARLSLKETGFDQVPESRRSEAFEKHVGGWAEQMKNIANYLTKNP